MKTTILVSLVAMLLAPPFAGAQVTRADYERAAATRAKYQDLALHVAGPVTWIAATDHFWYRRSVAGGNEFMWVDASTQTRKPAFDHEKLAAAVSAASTEKYTAWKLPFSQFTFVNDEHAVQFTDAGSILHCTLAD